MHSPKDQASFATVESLVGNTPLVRLQRLPGDTSNIILAKLEGNNPAGSVKDRPALSMILKAEQRGDIKSGDTLIEATSGNTGIALAMVAAMRGYRMKLIMPANATEERKASMIAYGAELIEVTKEQGMEGARDLHLKCKQKGKARFSINFPIKTTHRCITKLPARNYGSKRVGGLRILSAQWERREPLWVSAVFSRKKIPISR